jgi:hypothetical protein
MNIEKKIKIELEHSEIRELSRALFIASEVIHKNREQLYAFCGFSKEERTHILQFISKLTDYLGDC